MNYINSALQILTLFFISHYLKNVTINLRAKLLSICAQKFLILCAKQHRSESTVYRSFLYISQIYISSQIKSNRMKTRLPTCIIRASLQWLKNRLRVFGKQSSVKFQCIPICHPGNKVTNHSTLSFISCCLMI